MAEHGPGATLAGYRIEAQIGRGGMGVVYRATQLDLGRTVALKVIAPELAEDEDFRARFVAECRTAASIDHPNVIPLFEAGEAEGTLFLAMRHVSGTDLRALIKEEGSLELDRAARIIDSTAAALDAAHERGLVHRDVKPANVLVAMQGGREHVYLTDFGLTKQVGSAARMTQTGHWVGTIDYVAPEQIEGKPTDARADIYALGCVLFQTLTGKVPFARGSEPAKLYAHLSEPPPKVSDLRPEVAAEIDAVVQRAMAKRPEDRFPSAGDLGRAARSATTGEPISRPERSVARGAARSGHGDTPPEAATTLAAAGGEGAAPGDPRRGVAGSPGSPRPGRRRLLVAGVIGALLCGAAVVAALTLGGDGGESVSPELAHLRARANDICAQSRGLYNAVPPARSDSQADLAARGAELAQISLRALRQLRRIERPPEVSVEYNAYLELRRHAVRQLQNAELAARRGDLAAYEDAQAKIAEGAQARYDAARAVGLDQCSRSPSEE